MAENRRLAVIMFSDVVGFTALMEHDEKRTLQILSDNLNLHKELLQKYNGQLVKELGDGMLCLFDTPSDAASCAIELIKRTESTGIFRLHIGIDLGEVAIKEGDVFGEGVNIASRLNSEASPGEIIVSDGIYKTIRNKEGFVCEFAGAKSLKNVSEPLRVYRLLTAERKPGTWQILKKKASGKPILISFLAIILIGIFIIYQDPFGIFSGSDVNKESKIKISVAPFTIEPEDHVLGYLPVTLTKELSNKLSTINRLNVVSSNNYQYAFIMMDSFTSNSKKFGFDYIVKGEVQIDGNTVTIKYGIMDVARDTLIYEETVDREIGSMDIQELPESFAIDIANKLDIRLTALEKQRIRERQTNNEEAWEAYKQGWNNYALYRKFQRYGYGTEWNDSIYQKYGVTAFNLFKKSKTLDPEFVLPRYFLGVYYIDFDFDKFWVFQDSLINNVNNDITFDEVRSIYQQLYPKNYIDSAYMELEFLNNHASDTPLPYLLSKPICYLERNGSKLNLILKNGDEKFPNNPFINLEWAILNFDMHNYQDSSLYYLQKGMYLFTKAFYNLQSFEESDLAISPMETYEGYMFVTGQNFGQLNDFDAYRFYNILLAQSRFKSKWIFWDQIKYYHLKGDYQIALDKLQEMEFLDGLDFWDKWFITDRKGCIYNQLGRYEDARKVIEEGSEYIDLDYYLQYSLSLNELGDKAKSMKIFKNILTSLDTVKDDPNKLNKLVAINAYLGNHDKATQYLDTLHAYWQIPPDGFTKDPFLKNCIERPIYQAIISKKMEEKREFLRVIREMMKSDSIDLSNFAPDDPNYPLVNQ